MLLTLLMLKNRRKIKLGEFKIDQKILCQINQEILINPQKITIIAGKLSS